MEHKLRVVIIDHFDSFTYNLVVAFESLGATVQVFRTDTNIEAVERANPTHIVLSPGPGHPKDVLLFEKVLAHFKGRVSILGVCLGHQAIGLHFGAAVDRFGEAVMHGKTSAVVHNGVGIFHGVPNPLTVCRYHSLAILKESFDTNVLCVTARSENDGTIMAVQFNSWNHIVVGVQFHPESLFTEFGSVMLENFLKMEVDYSNQSGW
ncbi:aminodeoxychorismate/anthranilate synthase component II [Candidatus Nomurabacteria bacterium]|nr:aminodeoxychorismate/anthranilate synthase component II [Candidatus Nomurabacteria bacterium]